MRDNTALVGLARLWGDYEGRILLSETISTSVMKGYDDMDLARLLDRWAEEYLWSDLENPELEEFFHAKLKELCEEYERNAQNEAKTVQGEATKYYVVETWDRELQSVTECASLEEAVCAVNELLNAHLEAVGHGDEVEVEYEETSDWCRASAKNRNAWCNYQGNWDAFIKKHK